MSSIPTSPISPSHRRQSIRLSSFEIPHDAYQSPYTSGTTNGTNFSRRSSRTSQTSFLQSPVTPRPISARSSRPSSLYHRRKSSGRLSIGSNISFGNNDGGLGNLADELEDALDDEYEMNESGFLDEIREGDTGSINFGQSPDGRRSTHNGDNLSQLQSQPQSPVSIHLSLQNSAHESPTRSKSEKRKSRHQRIESKHDGSDYGPESEDEGITPALAKRMKDIESLARSSVNMEDTLSEGGGVVRRTAHALRDLGPQSAIESNLSRMISAHTSMATHRMHKTREITSQTRALLYGSILMLPEEVIDALLTEFDILISTLALTLPENPLIPLQILASQTLDLAHSLRSLTDTLQESRIQSNTATRKLKSVKEMVDDFCTEQELVETSMMLIQAGDWDRRCKERQAAATCRDVIRGFGEQWGMEADDRPWMHELERTVS